MGNQTSLPKDELENLQERTYFTLPELESLLKFGGFSKEKPKLSPEEVNRLLARVFGFSFSKFDEIQNGPFIKSLFTLFDSNEDGSVDAMEFALVMSVLVRGRDEEKLHLMFKLIDRDHKGKISKQEFTQIVEILWSHGVCLALFNFAAEQKKEMNAAQFADKFFEEAKPADGKNVTFEEFEKTARNYFQAIAFSTKTSTFSIWKRDAQSGKFGVSTLSLPFVVENGPADQRVKVCGGSSVASNIPGQSNFLVDEKSEEMFDVVHTFAIVRKILNFYETVLRHKIEWKWESWDVRNPLDLSQPISVYPRGLKDVAKAKYDPTLKGITFGYFKPKGEENYVYTCRSLDIVAHETGHAILDGLQPKWSNKDQSTETAALHECFGDLTCLFIFLTDREVVEYLLKHTSGNLHASNCLASLSDDFGLYELGRKTGIRNAQNTLKMSQVHDDAQRLSTILTGAIYDSLVDIFEYSRVSADNSVDLLIDITNYFCSTCVRAFTQAPQSQAQFADITYQILSILKEDMKPKSWIEFFLRNFGLREIQFKDLSNEPIDLTDRAFLPTVSNNRRTLLFSSAGCDTMSHLFEKEHGSDLPIDTVFVDVGSMFDGTRNLYKFPENWFEDLKTKAKIGVIVTSAEHQDQFEALFQSQFSKYFDNSLVVRYSMKRDKLIGMTTLAVQVARHGNDPYSCLLISQNVYRRTSALAAAGMQTVPHLVFAKNNMYKYDLNYVVLKVSEDLTADRKAFLKENTIPLLFTNLGHREQEWLLIVVQPALQTLQQWSSIQILKGNPRTTDIYAFNSVPDVFQEFKILTEPLKTFVAVPAYLLASLPTDVSRLFADYTFWNNL